MISVINIFHMSFAYLYSTGYWNFSIDELAHYDLPAMLEKALEVTTEGDLVCGPWIRYNSIHGHVPLQARYVK